MTEYELSVVRTAFEHALKVGAPGLSLTMQGAVVLNATIRLRHQLNVTALSPDAMVTESGLATDGGLS